MNDHAHGLSLALFILPMRNWNHGFTYDDATGEIFLSYLWGIEIHICVTKRKEVFTLFILPMRNWNYYALLYLLFHAVIFLSYLWGIEIFPKKLISQSEPAFLSYLWGIEINQNLWRIDKRSITFYPTYEELKCIGIPFTVYGSFPFYPTYEELKYEFSEEAEKALESFLSYLWGIEIFRGLNHTSSAPLLFLSYLWGIEIISLLRTTTAITLFILPMRNWNNFAGACASATTTLFILPMRNWNVYSNRSSSLFGYFLSYLFQNKKASIKGRFFIVQK